MVKLGLIAFANHGGLGNQTLRLAQMLNPDRVLIIDSSGFSPNKQKDFDLYKDYRYFTCSGFPSNDDIDKFLPNLTHVLTCENPYNFYLLWKAEKMGIKTYVQSNYEFCDNLDKPFLPVPTKFLMPSHWKMKEMQRLFGKSTVIYLPPPIKTSDFRSVFDHNLGRTGKVKFLHIIGTLASYDRNGTLDLLDAIKLTKGDFELVIHSQHPLPMKYFLDDPRVSYRLEDFNNVSEIYRDFDVLLLPRRWGGLSLTTNEGLFSGLPVIMTDISPNRELLPKDWLIKSKRVGQFKARSIIPVYSADHKKLADKIDWLSITSDLRSMKLQARDLGEKKFSFHSLLPKYEKLFTTV